MFRYPIASPVLWITDVNNKIILLWLHYNPAYYSEQAPYVLFWPHGVQRALCDRIRASLSSFYTALRCTSTATQKQLFGKEHLVDIIVPLLP